MTYTESEIVASAPELPGSLPIFSNAQPVTLLPYQLKAARAFLGWGRNKLGQATNISPETIKNIEHGKFKPKKATNDRLIRFFAAHGVEILNLMDFRMRTLSGAELDMTVNVAGIVFVTPTKHGIQP